MGTSLRTTTSIGMVLRAGFLACAFVALSSSVHAQPFAPQSAAPNARYLPDSGYSQRREARIAEQIKSRSTQHTLDTSAKPPVPEKPTPPIINTPSLSGKSGGFANPFDKIVADKIAAQKATDSSTEPTSALQAAIEQPTPPTFAARNLRFSAPQPMLIPTRPLYPQAAMAPVAARPTKPDPKVAAELAAYAPQVLPVPDVNAPPPPPAAQPMVAADNSVTPMILPEPVAAFAASEPKAPVATAPENQSLSDTEKEVEALRKEAEMLVAQAARRPEDEPTLTPSTTPTNALAQPEMQMAQAALPAAAPEGSMRPEILPLPDAMPTFKPYATIETLQKKNPSSPEPVAQPAASSAPAEAPPTAAPQNLMEATLPTPKPESEASASKEKPPAPSGLLPLPDLTKPEPTAATAEKKPLSLSDVTISESSVPKKGISDASKKILEKLPAGVGSEKPEKPGKLSIKRFDPAIEGILNAPIGSDDKVETSEAGGVSIQVKSPTFNADVELERAYNALIAGQTEHAKDIYLEILTKDPNNESALFGMASTFHRMSNLELARPFYARLLKVNPNHRDGLNNFLVLMSEEDPEEALLELQTLAQRNPDFSPIPAQMAVIHSNNGNVEAARKQMIRAIQLAPDNIAYKYNFAVMLDQQGDYAQAAHMYQQLIEASERGQKVPADIAEIQERLVYIRSKMKQ